MLRMASTTENDPAHEVSRAESEKPCLNPGRDQVRRSGISLWEIHFGVQLEKPCPRPCPSLCETLFKLSSSGNPVSCPGGPCYADFFCQSISKGLIQEQASFEDGGKRCRKVLECEGLPDWTEQRQQRTHGFKLVGSRTWRCQPQGEARLPEGRGGQLGRKRVCLTAWQVRADHSPTSASR